jgi:hypothetical protein
MDATLLKSQTGLVPGDDATREWLNKVRMAGIVYAKVNQPRNPQFHRKMFALLNYGFDFWAETAKPVEYKGQEVKPNFERFRKDIVILAGHYHPVFNIKGEIRMEANSISYANMDEATFEQLYSSVIDVLLKKVFSRAPEGQWTEERLRSVVDGLLEFT